MNAVNEYLNNGRPTIVGYGVVFPNDETRREGIAGLECQVLPNSPEGYTRIYIHDTYLKPDGTTFLSWRGPLIVKSEYIHLTR
jgi:hypothetical protein